MFWTPECLFAMQHVVTGRGYNVFGACNMSIVAQPRRRQYGHGTGDSPFILSMPHVVTGRGASNPKVPYDVLATYVRLTEKNIFDAIYVRLDMLHVFWYCTLPIRDNPPNEGLRPQ